MATYSGDAEEHGNSQKVPRANTPGACLPAFFRVQRKRGRIYEQQYLEFRAAPALCARAGIIHNGGRAADELLWDPLWKNHQTDRPPSLLALTLAHGEAGAFLTPWEVNP